MAHYGVQYSYNLSADGSKLRLGHSSIPLSSIPANIRHQFGDADCQQLLSDSDLVAAALQRNQRSAKRYRNPHVYYQDRPVAPATAFSSDELPHGTILLRNTYQDMSRIARNAFPGHNITYATGHTGSIHSKQVLDHADPVLGQHKVIKDDFSDYNQRVYEGIVASREWDRMKMNQPPIVDWATMQTKRPAIPAKPSQPPALKKSEAEAVPSGQPMEKKVTIREGPPAYEPPTAAPANPPRDSLQKPNAARQPDFERDEEFWKVYNAPVADTNSKKVG